jgi:APA family basic amino acid/polyamine antiporter
MKQAISPSSAKTATAGGTAITGGPQRIVRVVDAIALTVGIVIGSGIFRTPSFVAGNASSASMVYLVWVLGGIMSLVGALVYAELATTYPHAGGDYFYLSRAFGHRVSFLFAWARATVIQTGSIAFLSFVFGDYVGRIVPLGQYSSAIWAVVAVAIFTGLNVLGVRQGTGTQNVLTTIEVLGVLLIILAGFSVAAPAVDAAAAGAPASSTIGLMMVLVMLTYGGWNEAAYVAAELRDVRRNMVRVLVLSIVIITTLYLLINWAYLHALGLAGTAQSQQVAADVMLRAFGERGAVIISLLVAISALTSINATIFTGARTSYAFGGDFRTFAFLGRWNPRTGTPANALLVQGAIALALVIFGAMSPSAVQTMVDYTAPVFWSFFLLTGIALFVLRGREPGIERPFRVPLYPVTPILFCLMTGYLLYSSLDYNRYGALLGVAVLAVGAILMLFVRPTDIRHEKT